ncbi:Aminoacyl-tRNA synthetase, class Ic [Kalmanozyma brasiliensis GHG001]|uniref:Tryptophan--tRNA ligase, mitochondrial n=1 Tax=Kalmanozyma brasiliensis (strain GHG001) TaxID=1365824 RepID=V5GG48_KALBG|nr:Aminoacyl-tRNA synthetase, class Ic [Kalmanozyma brasiliensis GHG001]EST05002.1 Aminoacyl-tRNA synthetase, class Ic [Kalmanozyma brasiliensis GHG001]
MSGSLRGTASKSLRKGFQQASAFSSPIASTSKISRRYSSAPYPSGAQDPAKPATRPRVIFSGIQPTGIPHLGNYLGALRNWVDLQNASLHTTDELYFSIVGYHAITMPQQPSRLLSERSEMMATLLAIGLDPQRCTIFHQDQVSEHTELAWILNCITSFGKLQRMTTWKSKLATAKNVSETSDIDDKDLSLGLFAYPVLQAADILLYKATHVPVGEDQIQHLELSRDLADVYNRKFSKKFFPLPQHIITPTKRVLSLRDPASKMSKSAPDANSRILITDTPVEVERKIKKAVTDAERSLAYDGVARPGVSNLLSILAALKAASVAGKQAEKQMGPQEWAERLNREIEASGASSGQHLKATLTEAVVETLRPIQTELERLRGDPGYLKQMELLGKEKAQTVARRTMAQVRKSIGLN